jgi:hypothetical protein
MRLSSWTNPRRDDTEQEFLAMCKWCYHFKNKNVHVAVLLI